MIIVASPTCVSVMLLNQCGPTALLEGIHYRLPLLSKGNDRFGGNFTNDSLTTVLPGELKVLEDEILYSGASTINNVMLTLISVSGSVTT